MKKQNKTKQKNKNKNKNKTKKNKKTKTKTKTKQKKKQKKCKLVSRLEVIKENCAYAIYCFIQCGDHVLLFKQHFP